jgi:hypothetical protein
VAEIDYTDTEGLRSRIRLRPAYTRHNRADHMVVWGMPVGGLRLVSTQCLVRLRAELRSGMMGTRSRLLAQFEPRSDIASV